MMRRAWLLACTALAAIAATTMPAHAVMDRPIAGMLAVSTLMAGAPALPSVERIEPAQRSRADRLLEEAISFLLRSDFDRANPLLVEAMTVYERGWPIPEGLTRPVLDDAALLVAALTLGPDRKAHAQLMARYAVASQFRHRENKDNIPFGRLSGDGDRIAALALILHRYGEPKPARTLLRALASNPDLGVRQSATSALLGEVRQLRNQDEAQAEAVASFAVELLDGSVANADREATELNSVHAELVRKRGGDAAAGRLLAKRMIIAPVEEKVAAERKIDAAVLRLFAAGAETDAMMLLAEATGSTPGDLDVAAAAKLDALAGDAVDAEQEEKLRRMALDIYQRKLPANDVRLHRALGALASTYVALYRHDEAEQLYRRALAISERIWGPDSVGAISDSRALAGVLQALQRPAEAEAVLRRLWTMLQRDPDLADVDYSEVARTLTAVLVEQGKIEEAEILSRAVVTAAEAAPALRPLDKAPYLVARALVLSRAGRGEEAQAILEKAQALLPPRPTVRPGEVGDIDFHFGTRREIALMLASLATASGRLSEAETLQRAFYAGMSLDGTQAAEAIETGTALADTVSRLGRSGEADRLFAELGAAAQKVFGPQSRQAADVARAHAVHLLRSQRADRALTEARRALAAWSALQDRINPSAGEAAHLERLRQQRAAAWLTARAALTTSPGSPPQDMFEALQRAELSAAGAALARKAAREQAARAGAGRELDAWQAAQRDLAALDERIAALAAKGAEGDAERIRLQTARDAAEARLQTGEQALRERFPRFFDLIASRPAPLSLFTGRDGLLRADEALVLLAPGSDELPAPFRNGLVFVATREGLRWAPITMDAQALRNSVAALHDQLAGEGGGETDAPDIEPARQRYERAEAHRVYRALFADPRVQEMLAGKPRWTLAPQGFLVGLPFAALVTHAPPGGAAGDTDPEQLRATRWLGLERTLALVPSVASIALQRGAPSALGADAKRLPFFGVGDPAFRGVPDSPPPPPAQGEARAARNAALPPGPVRSYFRGAAADPGAIAKLSRLTNTAGELRTLAQILQAGPDSILLQMDATEAKLRQRNAEGLLRRTDVIAFATHGLIGGELDNTPAEPSLALTPGPVGNVPDPADDGLLTASEAAGLELGARFVILSACNTAAGGPSGGESLSGLARAFFYAGAKAMLVSHFPIFDASAPRLTGDTVRLSIEGLDSASAMRAAMRTLAADPSNDAAGLSFAHPKAWAAFAVLDAD
jgi:hypothetical protein